MTISSETIRNDYTGNGSTTVFGYTFKTLAASDLKVVTRDPTTDVETTEVLNTDYTVSGVGSANGGNVTFVTAPASGIIVTIISNAPYTQTTDIRNQGAFYPSVHEDAFDKIVRRVQQLREKLTRAFQLPETVSGSDVDTTLPAPEANKVVAWNDDATSLINVDAESLATIVASGNIRVDKFSGDGATTQFSLSSAGGSANNLQVYIDGVHQSPATDYTLSGTLVTFTTAPPTGTNNVVIRYGSVVEVGIPPDGSVTNAKVAAGAAIESDKLQFTPAGAGAVARTVQAKLREAVSVTDFEAVGDGVTDDAPSFQAAIDAVNAAGGGDVRVPMPSSFWRTTSTINMKAGVRLIFEGAQYSTNLVNYIKPSSAVTVGLKCEELKGVGVRGIGVDMSDMLDGSYGVEILSCWHGDYSDIVVKNMVGANSIGYFVHSETTAVQGNYLNTHSRVRVSGNTSTKEGTAFKFSGQTGATKRLTTQNLISCGADNATIGFVFKDFGSGLVATNLTSENNSSHGIQADDMSSGAFLTLVGGEVSSNGGWGITGNADVHTINLIDGSNSSGNTNTNVTLQRGRQLLKDATRVGASAWIADYFQVGRQNLTLAAADTIPATYGVTRVAGSGGAVTLSSNPQIADPASSVSQVMVIFGGSNTNTVTLVDGQGLRLKGNITLGLEDSIILAYDASFGDWVEVARSVATRGATSVADGGTVAHSLGASPTAVLVTPTVSGEFVSVTAKSSTNFTVAIKKHDGTAGTTQTVYWMVLP